jgi:hypothetical protein
MAFSKNQRKKMLIKNHLAESNFLWQEFVDKKSVLGFCFFLSKEFLNFWNVLSKLSWPIPRTGTQQIFCRGTQSLV